MWQDKLVIHRLLLSLFVLALAFSGCSSPNTAVQKRNDQKGEEKKPSTAASSEQTSSPDCVRGEPEALLSSQSVFKKSSPGEAQEAVRTDSPIKLTIRHYGCTHYALDFDFTWPDRQMPEPQVSLKDAAGVLEKLPVKEANRQAMTNIVAAMRKMAQEPYEQPLRMSESETLTATTPALNVLRVRYDVAL
ncbi:MAG: hypothetical protein WD696_23610 [Bryobacteraceae bacterium]